MVDLLEMLRSDKPNLPNKFTIALGELIRKARVDADISQAELAQKAYINQAAISRIESGKRSVSLEELIYLGAALNKPIQYFFSMKFLNPIEDTSLSILEQELLLSARRLNENDLKKIIAQINAINNMG